MIWAATDLIVRSRFFSSFRTGEIMTYFVNVESMGMAVTYSTLSKVRLLTSLDYT